MIACFASESSIVKIAGQRLDIDVHGAARLFEQILVGMREQHDGFFRMIDDIVGEARLVVDDQRDFIFARGYRRR